MQPLRGRRIWFAGIGGAGLSGYAVVAKEWGAEVAGWDRNETPYLEHVRAAGIPVTVAVEPTPAPDGWEAVALVRAGSARRQEPWFLAGHERSVSANEIRRSQGIHRSPLRTAQWSGAGFEPLLWHSSDC